MRECDSLAEGAVSDIAVRPPRHGQNTGCMGWRKSHLPSGFLAWKLPVIACYAAEARPDLEARDPWFFLHQSSIACEHLTEVQHCRVETISYVGVIGGKHFWLART